MGNLQSTPSSSTTTTFQKKHDVFLNFRGEDTHVCFTCHLYKALHKEIETFTDVGPALKGVIEQSKVSVIIFSKDYASSKRCLRELVEIMERKNLHNQIVIPVFYHVDPLNVRNQTGSFKDSFDKHGEESQEEVQKWREALTEASGLAGWDSSKASHDAELIDQIVEDIWTKLKSEYTPHEQIEHVISLLHLHVKTNGQIKYKAKIEAGGFIENVRERLQNSAGLVSLQKEFISRVLKNEQSQNLDGVTIPSGFLCSLSYLDLSDFNLKVISEDICHLSKLKDLDLSGNDFESLPKCMKQLSNLKILRVNNCNMLQSLTELPLSIELLRASDCKQLQSIPDASELALQAEFTFTNCPNLEETVVENISATVVRKISATVEGYEGEPYPFSFCCPGSKVPEWFKYKSDGSSIRFQRDCFNGLLLGFIVCAVIEFEEYRFDATYGDGLFISWEWECSGSGDQLTTSGDTLIAASSFGTSINSDHVALRYCTAYESGFTDFSFKFCLSDKRRNCRVKSCGVQPITKILIEDDKMKYAKHTKLSGVTVEDIGETSG